MLLNRFLANPNSLKFKKIERILFKFGFEKIGIRGSHHKYGNEKLNIQFTIPIHNNECRNVYKKDIAKLLKDILTIN